MTTNTKKQTKNILAILLIVLISCGAYYLYNQQASENTGNTQNTDIQTEKNLFLTELEEMSAAYDIAIYESKEKDIHLEKAKRTIENLIDSLKTTEVSIKELLQLKEWQVAFKSEIKNLVRENKELIQDNKILVHSLNKRKDQLSKNEETSTVLKKENETLSEEKEVLNNTIAEAKYLTLLDLKVEGIKERSSGKEIVTDKARRVNKFKICYDIAKNALVNEGDKTMQVQVLDPKNELVTVGGSPMKAEDSDLLYSFNTTFSYKNENLKVCDYLELNEDVIPEKGMYTIHIYDGKILVTTSTITLK